MIKKQGAKFNLNVQIKTSPNIFQYIKSDKDPIYLLETTGIYRIECTDKNNNKGYYVDLIKRKIHERLKEHGNYIKNAKNNTATARLALKENIKIDLKNKKKKSFQIITIELMDIAVKP